MPNVFDGVLILIVIAAMIWGWKSGLLRQLVAVSGTLAALMVAKQLYEPIGRPDQDESTSQLTEPGVVSTFDPWCADRQQCLPPARSDVRPHLG